MSKGQAIDGLKRRARPALNAIITNKQMCLSQNLFQLKLLKKMTHAIGKGCRVTASLFPGPSPSPECPRSEGPVSAMTSTTENKREKYIRHIRYDGISVVNWNV